MEVFLHKKDMPKSCIDCIFLPEYDCLLTGDLILTATNKEDIKTKRYSACPLKVYGEREFLPKYKVGDTGYIVRFSQGKWRPFAVTIMQVFVNQKSITYKIIEGNGRINEKSLHRTKAEARDAIDKWIGR